MSASGAKQLLEQGKSAYSKVEPPCPYFGTCGGCTLQDLAYDDQLALKRGWLQQAFTSLGYPQPVTIVGMDDPWRYRNKAELTFGEANGRMALGYHAQRSFWKIVDLEDCLLLPQSVTRILRDALSLAAQSGLPSYQPRTHQGFFRYALVRVSHATGRVLLCLITAPGSREAVARITDELAARHPLLTSLYWGVTGRVADIAVPEELVLLRGEPHLEERLGPFRLKLHPLSFLQPANVQASRMYDLLCRLVEPSPQGIAWDLYCGIGLMAFYLSSRFRKVYGIDSEARHLELAQLNASLNGLSNIECRTGRVETLLQDRRFWLQEAKPDVVVVDPPRAGLHPQAISSLSAARPKQLAYLSCNLQSLVRDLRLICSGFPRYQLRHVQAFDMFPQTHHMEILTLLDRS